MWKKTTLPFQGPGVLLENKGKESILQYRYFHTLYLCIKFLQDKVHKMLK